MNKPFGKGFNTPDNKVLSLDLVSSDKDLPFLNSEINFLDSSECLNPKDEPAQGLIFKIVPSRAARATVYKTVPARAAGGR